MHSPQGLAGRLRRATVGAAMVCLLSGMFPRIVLSESSIIPAWLSDLQLQAFGENDVLLRTDRYYTNGLKIGIGIGEDKIPGPVRETFRRVLKGSPGRTDDLQFGLFAGQNMYTPKNITIAAPQVFDRPWAGWLYLGLVGQRLSTRSQKEAPTAGTLLDPDTLETLEIDVGVVGPDSRAEDVQTWRHRQINSPHPEGWANQIPNETAFLVSYLQKHRYRYVDSNDGFDVISHAGVTLGTVMTFARAGGIVRYGFNKTGFGPDVIEPGGAMLQGTRKAAGKGGGDSWEWFVFGGIDFRLVAYNIFLDGTVFHDSPSVDRRPFVYDFLAGASARLGVLRVSFTRVARSEEFRTVRGGGGRQHFHSLNVGLEF